MERPCKWSRGSILRIPRLAGRDPHNSTSIRLQPRRRPAIHKYAGYQCLCATATDLLCILDSTSNYHLLHATFPSESVCTENLTPFLKLLPCKGRSGLATLLNPHRLFDSHWHGIGADVVWKEGVGVVVTLTFGAVMDPVRIAGGKRGELH